MQNFSIFQLLCVNKRSIHEHPQSAYNCQSIHTHTQAHILMYQCMYGRHKLTLRYSCTHTNIHSFCPLTLLYNHCIISAPQLLPRLPFATATALTPLVLPSSHRQQPSAAATTNNANKKQHRQWLCAIFCLTFVVASSSSAFTLSIFSFFLRSSIILLLVFACTSLMLCRRHCRWRSFVISCFQGVRLKTKQNSNCRCTAGSLCHTCPRHRHRHLHHHPHLYPHLRCQCHYAVCTTLVNSNRWVF